MLLALFAVLAIAPRAQQAPDHPPARRGDVVDVHHGESVPDPYRWLEDTDAPETRAWIAAQERLVQQVVGDCDALQGRLLALAEHDRRSTPVRRGALSFDSFTPAGSTAPRLRVTSGDEPPRVLLDAARDLTADERWGSFTPSQDGALCAVRLTVGDAPFQELRVLDVASGAFVGDRVRDVWGGASWHHDSRGFFYARFPSREPDSLAALGRPAIWWHAVGSDQADDRLVYERPEPPSAADGSEGPDWLLRKTVTHDGRYLLLRCARGSDFSGLDDEILVLDLATPDAAPRLLVADADPGRWAYVDHRDGRFILRTTADAPRGRLVRRTLGRDASDVELVPEGEHGLASVSVHPDRLGLGYLVDARTEFRFVARDDGELLAVRRLPGNVTGLPSDRERDTVWFSASLLFDPGSLYRFDVRSGELELAWRPELQHDPERFELRQVFYRSQDGTRVPMWIAGRRDVLAAREPAPLFLYAYGSLGWAAFPWYQAHIVAWMERGGLYALPGIRGGGEYGDAWWEAGRRRRRQVAIDDMIAAAEWLGEAGYTAPERCVVDGGSASGVLAAAAAMQAPERFAAALIEVPKLDMLRAHLFTGGRYSIDDTGTAEDPEDYAVLRSYSPLHNVRPGIDYPAMLVTAGEDDGVCPPVHGYKFVAEMQARSTSPHPALLLPMRNTGHGWGRSKEARARHQAMALTFLERVLAREL